ncbi:MAG: histone deacetylase [candidate division WOR-3 bacterium]|nr:MAG: histone deacetylase [candidate division WOR-3 bacterium]
MNFVYSRAYTADIGRHVFPTEKYSLIYTTLKQEGILTQDNLFEPQRPDNDALLKVITEEYRDDLVNARMTARTYPSEMPVTPNIINAQILCCGGSSLAAELALPHGACYHIGGGFHHAFRDHAEGFCYLNDVVYAAVTALEQGVDKVAVIDCDLHQGNGTAHFFQDERRVFTFSMHQERLYPKKERSDLDIGLDIGVSDDEYLEKLAPALDRIFGEFNPALVIYLAGADPYIFDQLGSLRLSVEGLRRRDELVCEHALSRQIPVAVVLGGGYAEDVADTVEIHSNTARVIHGLEKKY